MHSFSKDDVVQIVKKNPECSRSSLFYGSICIVCQVRGDNVLLFFQRTPDEIPFGMAGFNMWFATRDLCYVGAAAVGMNWVHRRFLKKQRQEELEVSNKRLLFRNDVVQFVKKPDCTKSSWFYTAIGIVCQVQGDDVSVFFPRTPGEMPLGLTGFKMWFRADDLHYVGPASVGMDCEHRCSLVKQSHDKFKADVLENLNKSCLSAFESIDAFSDFMDSYDEMDY